MHRCKFYGKGFVQAFGTKDLWVGKERGGKDRSKSAPLNINTKRINWNICILI